MKYDRFTYLWPPRAERAIPTAMLPGYEQGGYFAQIKKNGTCNIMAISPDREIVAMNRHKEAHRAWRPDGSTQKAFQSLQGGWYVFVAELLHSKVPGIRHINYINDILVADSESLVGVAYAARQERLRQIFPIRTNPERKAPFGIGYSVIDEHTWLADNYTPGDNYFELFKSLTDAADEGLVLKKPDAGLVICARPGSNTAWQVKVRRPTKVLHF